MTIDTKLANLLAPAKVLVVDDEYYMRKVLRTLLMCIGVRTIYEASDGLSGLAEIRSMAPVLSRLFRRLMLEMLVAANDADRLQFFGDHAHLADKAAFKAYLAPLHRTKWFVHSKRPFAGPEQVLAYLSRYTH